VGVAEVIERGAVGRAVGVGGSVDVDIHAAGEEGEVGRGLGLGWGGGGMLSVAGRAEKGGEREDR
jgi:hypothetical protein